MINKGRNNTGELSPLIFMAHFLEIIAVVLFLVMAIEGLPRSSEDQIMFSIHSYTKGIIYVCPPGIDSSRIAVYTGAII